MRGRLLLGGTRPETCTLADWLDAGERMIYDPIEEPLTRDIFARLFAAETEEEMNSTFEELGALSESLQAETAKAIDKERIKRQVTRRVTRDDMADAAAEWGMDLPSDWGVDE